jgi:hypothetical protein
VITEREDGACDAIEQGGRRLRATEQIAVGNIARADKDELIRTRRRRVLPGSEFRPSDQQHRQQRRS